MTNKIDYLIETTDDLVNLARDAVDQSTADKILQNDEKKRLDEHIRFK